MLYLFERKDIGGLLRKGLVTRMLVHAISEKDAYEIALSYASSVSDDTEFKLVEMGKSKQKLNDGIVAITRTTEGT